MTGSAAREARVVDVALAGGEGYPVLVGSGALERLPALLDERAWAHRYVIVADARVASLHGARVRGLVERTGRQVSLLTFPPGEASKSREQWAALSDALFHEAVGRDGCVVALGGGVTGDLAGFVAATYMRGIPVVQLPTSLVAMIDASVGGKTGIDVPSGKNLVGAFHPPRFVLADPVLAETLPEAERCQGLAEAAKHGDTRGCEVSGLARGRGCGPPLRRAAVPPSARCSGRSRSRPTSWGRMNGRGGFARS
jgi:3-dehydroquinate synthase